MCRDADLGDRNAARRLPVDETFLSKDVQSEKNG